MWPAVQEEYGRLRAKPGLIVAGLTAVGLGGGWIATRQLQRRQKTRLLGTVKSRKLRKRVKRKKLMRRLRPRRKHRAVSGRRGRG